MIFEIDFNQIGIRNADEILKKLECSEDKRPGYRRYTKEINSIEEMEQFQKDVWKVMDNTSYSFVLDFGDSPTIYFDDKV